MYQSPHPDAAARPVRRTMAQIEELGRKAYMLCGQPWRDAVGLEVLNVGNDAQLINDAGESWKQFRSLDAISARATEIKAGITLSVIADDVARTTGLPAAWIKSGDLGVNGLTNLVKAVDTARLLGEDHLEWPARFTASQASQLVHDLQKRLTARKATDALVTEAVQAAAVMQITGSPPAALIAELKVQGPAPVTEIVDIFAEIALEIAVLPEPVLELPPPPAVVFETVPPPAPAPVKARIIVPETIVSAKILGTTAIHAQSTCKAGDRVVKEDGSVHFACTGYKCAKLVPEAKAWVSTRREFVYRAYGVPLNRHILASDIDRDHGHPVFCRTCAERVLKDEDDRAPLNELKATVAKRTDNELIEIGRSMVQTTLRNPTASGVARSLLREIGLWQPGVEKVAADFFASEAGQPWRERGKLVHPSLPAPRALQMAGGNWSPDQQKPQAPAANRQSKGTQPAPAAKPASPTDGFGGTLADAMRRAGIIVQPASPAQLTIVTRGRNGQRTVETARRGIPDHVHVMADDEVDTIDLDAPIAM